MHQSSGSISSNLFWKLGERTLAQFISFVVSIVLGRILSPEDYGVVSMVMVFISFADVFVSSGFSTSLIQKKNADETDFSTIFYCSVSVSFGIYIILFLVAPFISSFFNMPTLTSILRVLCLRVPIAAFNSVQQAYVSRHMQFKKFFFSTLFGTMFSAFIGIALAYNGAGAWALVAQYLANSIINSFVLSITIDWHPKFLFSIQAARHLMQYGWKILAADFSGTFFNQLRSLIIGKFYTSADLAYYNRGAQFSSLLSDNISASVMSVLFPALANEVDSPERLKLMLRKGIKMLAYILLPMGFGIAAIARPLVLVLLTEKWLPCVPIIQILCISSVIGVVGNAGLQAIKAVGRSDEVLRLEFYKKPIYVLFLIFGVRISVEAIAFTMLLYSVYSNFVNTNSLQKIIGYSYREQLEDLRNSFSMSILMFFLVLLIGNLNFNIVIKLFIQIAVGVFIYTFVSFFIKDECFLQLLSMTKFKLKIKKIR